jgi:hypothetical protein
MINKDSMYPYIWAWGRYLGSSDYYMEQQEEFAKKVDALHNVIYFDDHENRWVTVDEVMPDDTRAWLHDFVHLNFKADLEPNTETAPGKVTNPEHRADLIKHEELKPEEDRDDDS